METDLEKYKKLFTETGVKYREEKGSDAISLICDDETKYKKGESSWHGYSGFVFEFLFDLNGKLLHYGAFE